MLIDWSRLVPALVLLLTPIAVFHGPRVRHRALPQDWRNYWGPTLRLGLHTIDLLRGFLGAWYLTVALLPADGAFGVAKLVPGALGGLVLCLATFVQALVCKEENAMNAPFAFVAGLTLGFLPPAVGCFGLLIAAVVASGTRSAPAFFPVLAVAVIGAGFLFGNFKFQLPVWFVAAASAGPWFYALLFPRAWIVTHAQKRTNRTIPSGPDVLR